MLPKSRHGLYYFSFAATMASAPFFKMTIACPSCGMVDPNRIDDKEGRLVAYQCTVCNHTWTPEPDTDDEDDDD